jgi:DNA-binding NtrC family response regulator
MEAARILLVEDDPTHALLMTERLRSMASRIEHVPTCRDARRALDREDFDLVLLDLGLPDGSGFDLQGWLAERRDERAVVFVTSDDLAEHAVRALRSGACHYVVKRPNYLEQVAEAVSEALAARQGRAGAASSPQGSKALGALIGDSPAMHEVRRQIGEYGPSDAPVLITGETGTGKELVARALHEVSPRGGARFVAVNCAAIAPSLFESEVFGSVHGAYTGAGRDREGLVGAARGGTLFLDEIGELAPPAQAKLLRLLEAGSYRAVGASDEREADLRILAATNCGLEQAVARGEFRSDLYYRLHVLRIHLPPLRERRGDIPQLVEHFMARSRVDRSGRRATPEAVARLLVHAWPGNVRELEHTVERTLLAGGTGLVTRFDLGSWGEFTEWESPRHGMGAARLSELLRSHRGRLGPVARELGVSIRTVQRRLKELGLQLRDFRPRD